MADQFIKISGLWLNESSKGEKYFSGYLGNARIMIFKNKSKKEDNHPDYNMFVVPPAQEQGSGENDGEDDVPF